MISMSCTTLALVCITFVVLPNMSHQRYLLVELDGAATIDPIAVAIDAAKDAAATLNEGKEDASASLEEEQVLPEESDMELPQQEGPSYQRPEGPKRPYRKGNKKGFRSGHTPKPKGKPSSNPKGNNNEKPPITG